ncbi:hypothetical protein [Arthrobacter sp. GMC3]|nr:hypothetical protein [Arthrobacter sp. GMC3]
MISIAEFTATDSGTRVSTGTLRTTNPRDAFAEAQALPLFRLSIEYR